MSPELQFWGVKWGEGGVLDRIVFRIIIVWQLDAVCTLLYAFPYFMLIKFCYTVHNKSSFKYLSA